MPPLHGRAETWYSYRLFYRQFRRNFVTTGAVAPSGRALARAITRPLAAGQRGQRRILEVGAGTGVFTRAILGELIPGDRFDVFEVNPVFRHLLRHRMGPAQARGVDCQLHLSPVQELPADARFDFIISGLPLNNFEPASVDDILQLLMGHLNPGGVYSYFEYAGIRRVKHALVRDRAERARIEGVGRVVASFLSRHRCQTGSVPMNLPPALVRHVRNEGNVERGM